jgi:hypothetical protein
MLKKSTIVQAVTHTPEDIAETVRREPLLKVKALQSAIFGCAYFFPVVTNLPCGIEIFYVRADQILTIPANLS